MTNNEISSTLRRGWCRRLFLSIIFLVSAWTFLEMLRAWAGRREIPVFVLVEGAPTGPTAAQFKAAGMTNMGMPVPYSRVTNPPISMVDIAAIKRCLAHDRFLPLFPSELEVSGDDVEARYKMKLKRRTNGFHEIVVGFARTDNGWRIIRIHDRRGTACPARPWKWWEKLLDFVPFVD